MGSDLIWSVPDTAPDRAESLTLGPHRIGDRRDKLLDFEWTSVGGEIEVEGLDRCLKVEISHDPTNEIERFASVGKPLR